MDFLLTPEIYFYRVNFQVFMSIIQPKVTLMITFEWLLYVSYLINGSRIGIIVEKLPQNETSIVDLYLSLHDDL